MCHVKKTSYRSLKLLAMSIKDIWFFAKVGSREVCVFYEVTISVTEISSFFKHNKAKFPMTFGL
jgi:hypothetical protein